MSNEDINLIKLKIKLDYQKKQELKSQILKSIVQNKKVIPTYRLYAFFLLKKRKNINYKFKHICLKTVGGFRGQTSNLIFIRCNLQA